MTNGVTHFLQTLSPLTLAVIEAWCCRTDVCGRNQICPSPRSFFEPFRAPHHHHSLVFFWEKSLSVSVPLKPYEISDQTASDTEVCFYNRSVRGLLCEKLISFINQTVFRSGEDMRNLRKLRLYAKKPPFSTTNRRSTYKGDVKVWLLGNPGVLTPLQIVT